MKKNKYILIVVLVLILIAAILFFGNRNSTFSKGLNQFSVKDTAVITKVFLADRNNNSVLLERLPDKTWMLNKNLKARKSGIDMLFETLVQLSTKYPVPKKAHNNVVAQMATQSVKVEVYQQVYRIDLFNWIKWFQHEKLTRTFYVGGATADNMGTFMLMEGADVPFVVHLLGFKGYVLPRFSPLLKDWRDHAVFKHRMSEINELIMEIPSDPENSYKVVNKESALKIIRLNTNEVIPGYDTLRLLNFMTSFADLRFEAVLDKINPNRKDSIINSIPKNIITLVDHSGDTTVMKVFFKPNDASRYDVYGELYVHDLDRAYALINAGQDFVLIQYFVFDKVLRELSYFIPGK